jgi:6-phosphogluconolactonase
VECADYSVLLKFRTRIDAIEALAMRLAETLRAAVAANGFASLVVSGGSTPRGLFHLLRGIELPWSHVTILPSDERWVPLDDDASNEGMIRRELLQGPVASARLVSLYRSGKTAASAVAEIDARVAAIERPFDFVVLGMGTDGHTASLFPSSPDIERALQSDRQVVVQSVPLMSVTRVSLTTRALLNAGEIGLLMFGQPKLATLQRASQAGPASTYPIRAVLHQRGVLAMTYWAP